MLLDGRRGAPDAAAATTTPTARTTRSAGSTGACSSGTPTSTGSSRCSTHSGSAAMSSSKAPALTPQPTPATGAHRMARRGARPPGLGRPLALAGVHAAKPARAFPPPRHAQRLLGAADVRAAGGARRTSRQAWRRCIDTALASPDDINPWNAAPAVDKTTYLSQPRCHDASRAGAHRERQARRCRRCPCRMTKWRMTAEGHQQMPIPSRRWRLRPRDTLVLSQPAKAWIPPCRGGTRSPSRLTLIKSVHRAHA